MIQSLGRVQPLLLALHRKTQQCSGLGLLHFCVGSTGECLANLSLREFGHMCDGLIVIRLLGTELRF